MDSALRILEHCGYLHYEDNPDGKARLMFPMGRNDLYMLDNLTPNEDAIITALLRTYGGLFTDYVYIDESLVAYQTELSVQLVYTILKNLSARHIVNFIPQRKTPYITYTRDRVDGDKVIITEEAWESRRTQYVKRIEGILLYAQNNHICRSRQLLRYFGEETKEDCQHCDVCLAHKTKDTEDKKEAKQAKEAILRLLDDKKRHFVTELRQITQPSQLLDEALEYLIAENIIHIDGSYLYL